MNEIEIIQQKSIFSKIFSIIRHVIFITLLLYFFVMLKTPINDLQKISSRVLLISLFVTIVNFLVFYVVKIKYNIDEHKLYFFSRLLFPPITKKKTYKISEIKWVNKYILFEKERVLQINFNGKKKNFWPYHLALLDSKQLDYFVKQIQNHLKDLDP